MKNLFQLQITFSCMIKNSFSKHFQLKPLFILEIEAKWNPCSNTTCSDKDARCELVNNKPICYIRPCNVDMDCREIHKCDSRLCRDPCQSNPCSDDQLCTVRKHNVECIDKGKYSKICSGHSIAKQKFSRFGC